ncbi:MAG: hypothetical protein WEB58_04600 [Planctomycetaceae bacterium]
MNDIKTATSGKRLKPSSHLKLGRQSIATSKLIPSPENDALYRARRLSHPDFARLVESIEKTDVQAALLVSRDRYAISGHQRLAAANVARHTVVDDEIIVPIEVLDIRRSDHTPDEWIAILREHNTGREKTLDERIAEKMIDVAVVDAASQIVDSLVKKSYVTSETICLPQKKKTRAAISAQSRGFADAILHILNAGDLKGLNVNERAIHYRLLPPLNVRTSTRKDGFIYGAPGKDKDSVAALSRMLTRLRLNGEVPWHRIVDETRPTTDWTTYADAAEFIEAETRDLFQGFARDLLQSQRDHHVIVAEKLTIKGFVDRVAARYTMPTVIIRGNSGIDARHQIAERFEESGKRNLVLFILSDCDPAGDMIAESTVHSLRDEFDIPNVRTIRVAFTHQQADEFGLSANPGLVCKESSVTPKFIKRHGRDDCYELEAVSPQELQKILDQHIRANINILAYNREVELQNVDNAAIEIRRRAVREVMGSAKLDKANLDDDTGGAE